MNCLERRESRIPVDRTLCARFRAGVCKHVAATLAFMLVTLALVLPSPVLSRGEDADIMNAGPPGKTRSGSLKSRTIASYANIVALRPGVTTKCFPKSLKKVLSEIQGHFGKDAVLVSSGFRSRQENRRRGGARQSYHLRCMAADIRIDGVPKHRLARFARTLDGVGGVGTYSCNGIVHVDVGPKRTWHKRCGRR